MHLLASASGRWTPLGQHPLVELLQFIHHSLIPKLIGKSTLPFGPQVAHAAPVSAASRLMAAVKLSIDFGGNEKPRLAVEITTSRAPSTS